MEEANQGWTYTLLFTVSSFQLLIFHFCSIYSILFYYFWQMSAWLKTNLVAANTNTPVKISTPSNSVKNWKFNITRSDCIQQTKKIKSNNYIITWLTTRSVTPVLSCPLLGAIESNSSKKSRHGAAAAALENISLTWNQHSRLRHSKWN